MQRSLNYIVYIVFGLTMFSIIISFVLNSTYHAHSSENIIENPSGIIDNDELVVSWSTKSPTLGLVNYYYGGNNGFERDYNTGKTHKVKINLSCNAGTVIKYNIESCDLTGGCDFTTNFSVIK
jgi:hypothetical protein